MEKVLNKFNGSRRSQNFGVHSPLKYLLLWNSAYSKMRLEVVNCTGRSALQLV